MSSSVVCDQPVEHTSSLSQNTIKTRILILSDTHAALPCEPKYKGEHFQKPLPAADILIHCGDLTLIGRLEEHEATVSMICSHKAPLKIVIPGNHDITLDTKFYASDGERLHGALNPPVYPVNLAACRELYTGPQAQAAGIVYLEEGLQTFRHPNGAKFTVYASAYTPEFCQWAFAYERDEDRFNCPVADPKNSSPSPSFQAHRSPANPIPDFPAVDIMVTHGPPHTIHDAVEDGTAVGCPHLLRAVSRAKPRLHAFGHIHEGRGATLVHWGENGGELSRQSVEIVDVERLQRRGAFVRGGAALKHGQETLFVNASIMDLSYRPTNMPWVVDLELPAF